LLVDHGFTVGLEHPQPRAVGIAPALLDKTVGRIEKPESRGDHAFVGVKAEQPAHGPMIAWRNG